MQKWRGQSGPKASCNVGLPKWCCTLVKSRNRTFESRVFHYVARRRKQQQNPLTGKACENEIKLKQIDWHVKKDCSEP
jgi:hypothetical protein